MKLKNTYSYNLWNILSWNKIPKELLIGKNVVKKFVRKWNTQWAIVMEDTSHKIKYTQNYY